MTLDFEPKPVVNLMRRKTFDYTYRIFHPIVKPSTIHDTENLIDQFNESRSVIFVCHGNINRSPFAEQYLKNAWKDNRSDVSINSAGLIDLENRSSPEIAISVAKDFGVNLSEHSSTTLDLEDYPSDSIVFVFDYNNLARIRNNKKEIPTNTYYIGMFSPRFRYSVPDPNNRDRNYYQKTFEMIAMSIDNFRQQVEYDE
jgi:protein-tyrosine phosphatase